MTTDKSDTPKIKDVICYDCSHKWAQAESEVCPLCGGKAVTIDKSILRIEELERELSALKLYLQTTTDHDGEHHKDWVADCQMLERQMSTLKAAESAIGEACHATAIYGDQPPVMYLEALAKVRAAIDAARTGGNKT